MSKRQDLRGHGSGKKDCSSRSHSPYVKVMRELLPAPLVVTLPEEFISTAMVT